MKVLKYPLDLVDLQMLQLPAGAKILCAKEQNGNLFLWALVNPEFSPEFRQIRIAGTGHTVVEPETYVPIFIDTIVTKGDSLVLHVFDLTS